MAFYIFQLMMFIVISVGEVIFEPSLIAFVVAFILVPLLAWMLNLCRKRSIWFIRITIGSHVLFGALTTYGALSVFNEIDAKALAALLIPVGWAVLGVGYFILSRRINVTYRHRVKEEDIPQVWGAKKIARVYGTDYFD